MEELNFFCCQDRRGTEPGDNGPHADHRCGDAAEQEHLLPLAEERFIWPLAFPSHSTPGMCEGADELLLGARARWDFGQVKVSLAYVEIWYQAKCVPGMSAVMSGIEVLSLDHLLTG